MVKMETFPLLPTKRYNIKKEGGVGERRVQSDIWRFAIRFYKKLHQSFFVSFFAENGLSTVS